MALRDDALVKAARFVLAVEQIATDGLVATVGTITVPGGAVNVVPGRVELTLDIRHEDDRVRRRAIETLRGDAPWTLIHEHDATPCVSAALSGVLPNAPTLVSGAGHDVVTMAAHTDVALLFVRSTGGSHNPGEAVREDDVAAAIDAAVRFACSI
jgi:allantoate deiminase